MKGAFGIPLGFLGGGLGGLGFVPGSPLRDGGRTRSLQIDLLFGNLIEQTASLAGSRRGFGRPRSFNILSHSGSNNVTELVVIGVFLLHLLQAPILRRQVVLVLGVQLSVLVLELPGQFLEWDPPGLFEGVPAMRGDTADLTMITLWYTLLVEPPKVRPEEHERVGRTRGVSILALAPAALGMEIGRDELALIGKRAQVLDGLRRERSV